ncbi:MAG: helix-turn-helix transcriptional regulator [Anaerovoracaceae bacterium]
MNTSGADCACRGKNLDKMLQPSILMVLYRERLHGFALIQKLGESPMLRGCEPDKAGVYRYLKKMESAGRLVSDCKIDSENGKPRSVFEMTHGGRSCLISWMAMLKQMR